MRMAGATCAATLPDRKSPAPPHATAQSKWVKFLANSLFISVSRSPGLPVFNFCRHIFTRLSRRREDLASDDWHVHPLRGTPFFEGKTIRTTCRRPRVTGILWRDFGTGEKDCWLLLRLGLSVGACARRQRVRSFTALPLVQSPDRR